VAFAAPGTVVRPALAGSAGGSGAGMAVSVNETEAKYDVPAGVGLPGLDDLPGVAGVSRPAGEQLRAEYYDTGDLRLIRAGITLRRRRGGDDAGWHLKLPADADTRREIRLPLGRGGRQVPAELAGLVRVRTRGEPLRPVALVTTSRQRLVLLGQAGESLAEVASDDVSAQAGGDAATLSRWHEVEVELTGGNRKLLAAADKLLRRGGLRPAGTSAKLERALAGRLPGPAHGAPLTSSSPAGQVVLAYLQAYADRLKSLDPMVRRDEPDAVHQMRVATRRLRSTLQSFGQIIGRDSTRPLAAELKWLGSALGRHATLKCSPGICWRDCATGRPNWSSAQLRRACRATSRRRVRRARRAPAGSPAAADPVRYNRAPHCVTRHMWVTRRRPGRAGRAGAVRPAWV
jgi:inorganic triphosphatase YgiF